MDEPLAAPTGALYALSLRLSPVEAGTVLLNSGAQAQAALLDLIRQGDPALSQRLHAPNQNRPYTLGLLRGFNHLTEEERTEIMAAGRPVPVAPGETYWLRVTMLDDAVFGAFAGYLLTHAAEVRLRIGSAQLRITRLVGMAEDEGSWAGHATFAELAAPGPTPRELTFEFATPTAFSLGQRDGAKQLWLFPEPRLIFGALARQWERFAPPELRLAARGQTPAELAEWCAARLVVARYDLATRYIPGARFGQTGFVGTAHYALMGADRSPLAAWLAPLARFAFYCGLGYKTAMGMGQARCRSLATVPALAASPGGVA